VADAHLNGSLNLPDAETVFRTVSRIAGDSIGRIPDGETDDRLGWIEALFPRLRTVPALEEVAQIGGYKAQPIFGLRDGYSGEDVQIPELGYAAAARESYAIFAALRSEGVIAPGTRFQVSVPTLMACTLSIRPEDLAAIDPAFASRLRSEIDEIVAAVPAEDLAIQWDVAGEIAIAEGVFPAFTGRDADDAVAQLAELVSWVPNKVAHGVHLCYGDAQETTGEGEGRHFMEPRDAGKLVELANALTARASRPLDWISMPVPIDRSDDAYFEPLSDLRIGDARLYLGLVHHQDGVAGTQLRIDTAKRYVDGFGVATECGLGRKPRPLVEQILMIQRDVVV